MEAGAVELAFWVAGVTGKATIALHKLYKDVRKDRQNAQAFEKEVQALECACSSIGKLIQSRQTELEESPMLQRDLEGYWETLESRLKECRSTVTELEGFATDKAVLSNDSRSILTRVGIQIKKQTKTKELSEVRRRIQEHKANLQLALETLQVALHLSSRNLTGDDFKKCFSIFMCRKDEVKELRKRRSSIERRLTNKSEGELLKISDGIAESAQSQYEASVGSAPGSSTSPSLLTFASLRETERSTPDHVESWFQDEGAMRRGISEPSTPGTETSSIFSRPQLVRNGSTADTVISEVQPSDLSLRQHPEDSDDCPDDEAEVGDVQNAIKDGRFFFSEANYRDANSSLQVAERGIAKLPSKRQRLISAFELRYMLAVCAFHIDPPSTAVRLLVEFTKQDFSSFEVEVWHTASEEISAEPTPPVEISQRLQVHHLLAITYLRLGNVEQARKSCKFARGGRHQHFGKDDLSYHDSSALMAAIERADGHPDEAKNIVSAIKHPRRNEIVQAIAAATASSEFAESSTKCTPVCQSAESQVEIQPEQHDSVVPTGVSSRCDINLDYSRFRSYDLEKLARTMNYRRPRPASLQIREAWAEFLKINIKELSEMSRALFTGSLQEAMRLTHPSSTTGIRPDALHIAALFGDSRIIEGLCRHPLSARYKWKTDVGKLTALHCAAIGGNRDIADRLIRKGCPINEDMKGFGTPLALAALGERLDVIDVILSHGARDGTKPKKVEISLDTECESLGSVVHAASAAGNAKLLGTLVDGKPLLDTSQSVQPARVRALRNLLETQSNSSITSVSGEASPVYDLDGRVGWIKGRPLAVASYFDCKDTVEYICIHGHSKVNAPCSASLWHKDGPSNGIENHTALTLASMQGNDSIRALLDPNGEYAEDVQMSRRGSAFSSRASR